MKLANWKVILDKLDDLKEQATQREGADKPAAVALISRFDDSAGWLESRLRHARPDMHSPMIGAESVLRVLGDLCRVLDMHADACTGDA